MELVMFKVMEYLAKMENSFISVSKIFQWVSNYNMVLFYFYITLIIHCIDYLVKDWTVAGLLSLGKILRYIQAASTIALQKQLVATNTS